MSTPEERTRSLVWAGGFLIQISRDSNLPLGVRQQAAVIARHFPTIGAIAHLANCCDGDRFGLASPSRENLAMWSEDLSHGPLTDSTRVSMPTD